MIRYRNTHPRPAFLSTVLIPSLILLTLFLSGCASIPVPTRSDHVGGIDPAAHCADFFDALDRRVLTAQAIDPGAFRVAGYPYLRVDRFLASFRDETEDAAAFAAWLDRMQSLDREARKHEIANLPDAGEQEAREALLEQVVTCGDLMKAADFQDPGQRRALRESVTAPDEYILSRQILGIYPITRLFIFAGVSRWHDEVHRTFSTQAPAQMQSTRYVSEEKNTPAAEARAIVVNADRDALGIPRYPDVHRDTLFRHHAPTWVVESKGEYDRIGTPYWTAEKKLAVNTGRPVAYTLLSHTRFRGEILTQLNYIIWYPARPKVHALDIYGGLLDGVNYRVTLDGNGEPLLYDTMHNCGCYYAAYPTPRLKARDPIDYNEPPLILRAPAPPPEHGMTVAMKSRTHFVTHFYPSTMDAHADPIAYTLASYNTLRSLPDAHGGRRSMFDPDSLAPGTQRLERWLFWPTGVYSAGATRQWGRHAVAFVGKRHFDDPFFMEVMFEAE